MDSSSRNIYSFITSHIAGIEEPLPQSYHAFHEVCELALAIDSWTLWKPPHHFVSENPAATLHEQQFIRKLIKQKHTFTSIEHCWQMRKKQIKQSMNEHNGFLACVKSEIALMNDDYAEQTERQRKGCQHHLLPS